MRGLLFIGLIAGLVLFMVLKKEDVERFDLDKPENKIEQVESEVQKAMDDAKKKLDDAYEDITH